MKIYALSGLGADQRVFNFLKLDFELVPLDWITPFHNESIIEYSKRLSEKINTSEKFGILGVSFGGLVATEISKILNPEITILISSAETKYELRSVYKWFGKTNLIKLIPIKLFNPPRKIAYYLFGTEQKQLLNQILNDTDLNFVKWAVNELINWKNISTLKKALKISGSKDKLIPLRNTKAILIEDGGHFMIVDRAEEISEIINKVIHPF